MEKKDIVNLLDEIFIPLKFKRKGNNWILNGEKLSKMVNLQKSNYGNLFYINYGYIIKEIELTTMMHIFKGLGSIDPEENNRIKDLLNFEKTIEYNFRVSDLIKFIKEQIVFDFDSINSDEDLLDELKRRPHLNNVPLVVKRHFKLE